MLSSVKNWWGATASAPTQTGQQDAKSDSNDSQPPLKDEEQSKLGAENSPAGKESEHSSKELLHAAKDIGSYIYTFGKRATTSVTSQARRLAAAPGIVEDFERQQREFASSQSERRARAEAAVPPWVGYENEDQLRDQILALSRDTRNFLRSPPQGANFAFDLESCSPVAMATLEVDENLRKMRFDLVPKRVKEDEFWRNYFYRVSLIRQSAQLSALARTNAAAADSASTSSDAGYEKVSPPPLSSSAAHQPQQQLKSSPVAGGSSRDSPAAAAATVDEIDDDGADCGDFASSELANQQPAGLSALERQRIGGGGGGPVDAKADDWDGDGELQREIKEFELVSSEQLKSADAAGEESVEDEELEREIMAELANQKD